MMANISSTPAESFGVLLGEYMNSHGMSSVVQFAERANMKATTIYALLNKEGVKRAFPSLPTLIQLATALEMPTHELLYIFAPDAPGAPTKKQSAKERLRAIGQKLPSTEEFLAQRRSDSRDDLSGWWVQFRASGESTRMPSTSPTSHLWLLPSVGVQTGHDLFYTRQLLMSLVLDASALIAWLRDEPGAERVETVLNNQEAVISTVNLAEVLSYVAYAGQDVGETKRLLQEIGLKVFSFTFAQAVRCGELRPMTSSFGLSLGDRACLALGIEVQATVLTADRQWSNIEVQGVEIELLRP